MAIVRKTFTLTDILTVKTSSRTYGTYVKLSEETFLKEGAIIQRIDIPGSTRTSETDLNGVIGKNDSGGWTYSRSGRSSGFTIQCVGGKGTAYDSLRTSTVTDYNTGQIVLNDPPYLCISFENYGDSVQPSSTITSINFTVDIDVPPVNKVEYYGETLIDISDTTAQASDVASGKIFYGADGNRLEGSFVPSGDSVPVLDLRNCMKNNIIPDEGWYKLPEEEDLWIYVHNKVGELNGSRFSMDHESLWFTPYKLNGIFYVGYPGPDYWDGDVDYAITFGGVDTFFVEYPISIEDTYGIEVIICDSTHYGNGYGGHTITYTADTSDSTVTEETVLEGEVFYNNYGTRCVGTFVPSGDFETPTITVSNTGLITASANGKSNTEQLPVQATKSVTPSKSQQTAVNQGMFTSGYVTVEPIPEEYITTDDANAVAGDIRNGKTAYVKGELVTGSIPDITMTHDPLTSTTDPTYALTDVNDSIKIPVGYNTSTRHAGISSTDKKKLIATNIKSGVTILGVEGSYEPTYDTPSIDVSTGGLITASANGKSNTKQLTTQAAKSVTPSSAQQTAVASGRYTTGAVTVAAVPTETKTAVTPTKSTQNITASSGKYMTALTVNPIPDQYIIPSGSETKTANGTYDVTNLAEVVISVPGGAGSGPKVEHGTATLSGTNLLTINHNLGKKPDFIAVWDSTTSTNSQKTHAIHYDSSVSTSIARYQYYRSGAYITKNVSTTKNSTSYVYMDSTVITLPYYSSTYTFSGTYYYIVGTYS